MLRAIARLDLLILDGGGPEPLNAEQRRDLLEVVEGSTRIPLDSLHQPAARPWPVRNHQKLIIAVAILGRLVHNAHEIELEGERLRKQKQAAQDQSVS
ncbi:ATP-binding protein [Bradyrhizobium sp. RDM12]